MESQVLEASLRSNAQTAQLRIADKVANAHREDGESVSADERAAIEAIAANLGTPAP